MTRADCRLEVVIRGRVQGVGFRHYVWRRAQELRLRGWVRNCADGSVAAIAEGPETALRRFLDQLRVGPVSARVESVQDVWGEAREPRDTFDITG
jgi:acylphosphatase